MSVNMNDIKNHPGFLAFTGASVNKYAEESKETGLQKEEDKSEESKSEESKSGECKSEKCKSEK